MTRPWLLAVALVVASGCGKSSSKSKSEPTPTTDVSDTESWRSALTKRGYTVGDKALPAAGIKCKGEHVTFTGARGATGTAGFLDCQDRGEVRKQLARHRRMGVTLLDGQKLIWVGVTRAGKLDVAASKELFVALVGKPGISPPVARATTAAKPPPASIEELVKRAKGTANLRTARFVLRQLAGKGGKARDELAKLTQTLPSGSAAIASGFLAEMSFFDLKRLERLALTSKQPMASVGAARALALHGGSKNQDIVAKTMARWKDNPRAIRMLEMARKMTVPEQRLTAAQLDLLDRLYLTRDPAEIKSATETLLASHTEGLAWGLGRLLAMPMDDDHRARLRAFRQKYAGTPKAP